MGNGRDATIEEGRAAAQLKEGADTRTDPATDSGAGPRAEEALAPLSGEALETFQRLTAELAEYRELTRRARADLHRLEQRAGDRVALPDDFLERLFPLLDGLQAGAANPGGDGFRAGLEVLHRDLASVLGALGATRIAPRPGDPFDPELMRSDQNEAPEVAEVTELLHGGWALGGVVVAPARVALRQLEPGAPQPTGADTKKR